MKTSFLHASAAAGIVLSHWLATSPASAQAFPSQPIKLVVPFAPGGGNDILARAIGPRMAEILGQPVVIENRPGAGGNLGTDLAAKAAPDGHTILIASNQITINPAIGAKTPFVVERDFAPIGQIASVPIVLVAGRNQPFNTLAEFMRFAKANPGKLSYSSPGNGTPQHLAGEVFARMTNSFMVHIPYRGTGPAVADVVGEQVQVTFGTLASVTSFLEAGKLKAIGVAGPRNSPLLPATPAFGEAKELNGYDAELWYCLLAPAKTPAPVVAKLNAVLNEVLRNQKVSEQIAKQGFEVATSTPEQLRARIEKDMARWSAVVSQHKIKVEQ